MTARQRAILVFLATLASVVLTLRLGFWQLDRAQQKLDLQAGIDANAKLPPLTSAALLPHAGAAQSQLHRHVSLRGRWLQDKTIYLDNRPMAGRFGFLLVTPLLLEGRTEAILVQRGWVPRDAADRSRLPLLPPLPTGAVEVLGRLTATPSKVYQLAGDEKGVIRQNLDARAYGEEIAQPLLPLTVLQLDSGGDASTALAADGLLRDWPSPDLGLHKHYGYAFQWFALSALLIGLYVWFQTIRPRLRARRQQ
ncbi:SURF1 family protein [Paucibacter sp. Y2R2-4]|uniref:SURF1 family protein n=1 Tax=Paucibacter sp. Y2R2-4 TaxID=2893553 RepID=UPI0021E50886|nr:SURF1 family protein [Paucibacter sp. Y2R2-4]MCV2349772.1 SURF1 family protein [Paucibacter sp. Y2R2-4]